MIKFISCIMADYILQDDGTMDCPWLTPYYGDMTEDEYHAAGTALSVRRGCEYCMKYLEFKTMVKEEGWKSTDQAAHAKHLDWPGEHVSVWIYRDGDGKLIGYECQDELFKSLHEIETAGWELIYSYCPAGKEIYRKEEESLNNYYTKCGREFKKSSTASVTGYKIDLGDQECAECPFRIKVTKGYPAVFDHWECRAGSQPPSQVDDWRGSVDDKANISIRSLHNDFLESVLEYCESQPDLKASYNQDLADCRRQISVSCSANKKGIAAKKALVEKFFNGKTEVPEETAKEKIDKLWATFVRCEACKNIIDEGDSVEYCKCSKKRGHIKRKQTACDKFEAVKLCVECSHCQPSNKGVGHPSPYKCFNAVHRPGIDFYFGADSGACENFEPLTDELDSENEDLESIDLEGQLDYLLKDGDKGVCPYFNGVGYHGTTPCIECGTTTLIGLWEKNKEARDLHVTSICKGEMDTCRTYLFSQVEEMGGKPESFHDLKDLRKMYFEMKEVEDVNCKNSFCGFNNNEGGCGFDESVNEIAEIDSKASETVIFDYSTVDGETAEFLQDKASTIISIKTKAMIDIAVELSEVHLRLANHYNGTFGVWCESIGITDRTARNYLSALEWVRKNFPNIDDAKDIQTSLLFAVSKPSAPKELQDQVLSGDITTHKQHKEKETEWKTKLDDARAQQDTLRTEKQQASIKAMDAERRADRLENEAEDLRGQLRDLQNQNNEPQDIEYISTLSKRITELENQLKDKPIETSAIQIVEKVPEKNAIETVHRLYGTLLTTKLITKQDIQIVHDSSDYVKKMAIEEFLEDLRDMIPRYLDILKDNVTARKCEQCEFSSWDGLKEADEDNGLILCTRTTNSEPTLIRNDSPCQLFKER